MIRRIDESKFRKTAERMQEDFYYIGKIIEDLNN